MRIGTHRELCLYDSGIGGVYRDGVGLGVARPVRDVLIRLRFFLISSATAQRIGAGSGA